MNTHAEVTTDKRGEFVRVGLQGGPYKVTAEKEGVGKQMLETRVRIGISPNTLSARLKRLEEGGVIERRFYEKHPPRAEDVLTEKGRALGPAMRALQGWGLKHT